MKAIGAQMAVGMFALALVAGALTYVVLLRLIRRHREKLAAKAAPDVAGEGAEPD
jgi:hypothetical protein